MRIGILTYHCPPNFGAQLQALSTVGYLRRQGHEPIVLDWYPNDLEAMYDRRIPAEQIACHRQFTTESLPLSRRCQTEEELIEEIDSLRLDALIAGSDALFKFFPLRNRRHFHFRSLRYVYHYQPLSCECLEGNPFFGAFLSRLKRPVPASTYAVSSQNCPFSRMNRTERRTMAEALANYRTISVRDSWTQQMVQHITGRHDVPIYPDPVFSFNENCPLPIPSREELTARYALAENYVLLSFSAKHYEAAYVKAIADEVNRCGFQPVALPMPERLFDAGIGHRIPLPISPLDWYALIIHSQGYIGERMHPIVVCLHNAIPFFCFDEYGTQQPRSRFSRQQEFVPTSSKTYLIVSDAGLLDNLYSAKSATPLPAPEHVMKCVSSFDKAHCATFAARQRDAYQTGMSDILKSLL